MKRLGLALESGAVHVSLVHYNTAAEVQSFGDVLARLCQKSARRATRPDFCERKPLI